MITQEVYATLASEFHLTDITDVQKLDVGFRCLNVSFHANGAKFFLKQYREKRPERITEVKRAEQWFAQQGIPIILPFATTKNETAFFCDDHWYSLFPFIEGTPPRPQDLTPHHVASLGMMHAKLHRIGSQVPAAAYLPFPFWDREVFLRDVQVIDAVVEKEGVHSDVDKLALENIRLQEEFVRDKHERPEDFGVPLNHLVIDDFIYTNVFFDERGTIQHVYDLERTGIGPRSYDLARSLFINCFDDGWNEKNFEFARIYLKAYQTIYPISREEFSSGIQIYTTHFMFMSWLEKAILVEKSDRHRSLIKAANARLHHFLGDREAMIDRMYVV